MLGLKCGDLSFPEERGLPSGVPIIVGLGLRTGTKLKRPQVAMVRPKEEPELAEVLRLVVSTVPVTELLFPYSLDAHRRHIKWLEDRLQVDLGWGPTVREQVLQQTLEQQARASKKFVKQAGGRQIHLFVRISMWFKRPRFPSNCAPRG